MDATLLLGLALGSFFFGLAIFLLVRSHNLRKATDELQRENSKLRDQLRGLAWRVQALERVVGNEAFGAKPRGAETAKAPANAKADQPAAVSVDPQQPPLPPKVPPVVAEAPASERPLIPQPYLQQPSSRFPQLGVTPLSAETTPDSHHWADLEERVGASWLNKIGTAAFVIGFALLVNYSMHYLGPRGKIGLGYALSSVFLAIGILGERRERYRIAARAVLGGGWALAYFTTYALHNIAAVRLVTNPFSGFALLFAVAVAIVIHSLRYHSEVTTAFAYLLAFTSVGVSHIPVGALIACALLAASLVLVLRVRRWYALEPFAIAATYLVHQLWINQIYTALGGPQPFPELPASVALLSTYWLIYMTSYFLRAETDTDEARWLAASFLVNACGYLAVLHSQAFHPGWRFWFLLVAGAAYLGVSGYARRVGRRWGFVLASTLGAALIAAAVPYRYSGRGLELLWLVETEALLALGWRAADRHLRKLGWAASAVLTGYVLFHDLWTRFQVWQPPNASLGWMLLALAVAFCVNGRFTNYPGSQSDEVDLLANRISPVLGTAFLFASAWVALPFLWVGLAWVVAVVVLVQVGRRTHDPILPICAKCSSLVAVTRLLTVDMSHTEAWHHINLRLITLGASSALLYLFAGAGESPRRVDDSTQSGSGYAWFSRFGGWPALYSGSASLLVTLLLWNEVSSAGIALAWGLFGLMLVAAALSLPGRQLKNQGRLLLLASFARIFFADLNSTAQIGSLPSRVITVGLLAAIYYFTGFYAEDSPRICAWLLWCGTISIAALLRFELPVEWVAVAWAAATVVLYALGARFSVPTLTRQSYAMALFVGIRCAFDNFYQATGWHFTNVRTATVVTSSLFLYVLFAATLLAKRKSAVERVPEGGPRRIWALLESHPHHLFFFVPTILLTVLLSLEVRRGFLTAAWGLEALVVFLVVLKMKERAYRWFSLLLLLLCVGRIATVDIWTLDAFGRIVSFMGLGAALLTVSFLYARHRELLRRVL